MLTCDSSKSKLSYFAFLLIGSVLVVQVALELSEDEKQYLQNLVGEDGRYRRFTFLFIYFVFLSKFSL